jgi:hypothetical protein
MNPKINNETDENRAFNNFLTATNEKADIEHCFKAGFKAGRERKQKGYNALLISMMILFGFCCFSITLYFDSKIKNLNRDIERLQNLPIDTEKQPEPATLEQAQEKQTDIVLENSDKENHAKKCCILHANVVEIQQHAAKYCKDRNVCLCEECVSKRRAEVREANKRPVPKWKQWLGVLLSLFSFGLVVAVYWHKATKNDGKDTISFFS